MSLLFFDLRTTLASDLRDPFHAVDLYLPFEALNAISDDLSLARVDDLHHTLGTAVMDTTLAIRFLRTVNSSKATFLS